MPPPSPAGTHPEQGPADAGGGRAGLPHSSITNISAVYSYTFYDATKTAYYIDPASTSNFSALNVGGSAVLTAGNYTSYISSGSEPTFSAFDGLPIGTS